MLVAWLVVWRREFDGITKIYKKQKSIDHFIVKQKQKLDQLTGLVDYGKLGGIIGEAKAMQLLKINQPTNEAINSKESV